MKVRLYESAEADVRYVYGHPVKFPLAHDFVNDKELGTAREQAEEQRKRYGAARTDAIQRAADRELAIEASARGLNKTNRPAGFFPLAGDTGAARLTPGASPPFRDRQR